MKLHYSEPQLDQLIKDIHEGIVTPNKLPKDLYDALNQHLEGALYKGFGSKISEVEFGTPNERMLSSLRDNVFMFSAAKDFQTTKEMSDALISDGKLVSFQEFKESAKDIFIKYNGGETKEGFKPGWLQTEYNTTIAQAQNAAKWVNIEADKDTLPNLTYSTAEDDTVCEICEPLDGVTLPVDDPFWDMYYPANHFNCYCIVEQTDDDPSPKEEREETMAHAEKFVPNEFKMNPGKSGEIFKAEGKDQHPYFMVPREYKDLAKSNFNLPLPKTPNQHAK